MSTPLIAQLDYETFSQAGYHFEADRQKWVGATSNKKGLAAVGVDIYARHPSTEVLCAAYRIGRYREPIRPGADDVQLWVPGMSPPIELLEHVRRGGLLKAWNATFEYLIWNYVCVRLYGWCPLPIGQMRCSMAEARAFGLPGKLEKAAIAVGGAELKDKRGKELLKKFSVPRTPTKKNRATRIYLGDAPTEAQELYEYCGQDVRSEGEVSRHVPELSSEELALWQLDQRINRRGLKLDRRAVEDCMHVLDGVTELLTNELRWLTNGRIQTVGQTDAMAAMLGEYGMPIENMQAETIRDALGDETNVVHQHPWARRMLEIRAALSSASVKKLLTMERQMGPDDRVRDSFIFCGAERTGRFSGSGMQPHNFPRGAAFISKCPSCGYIQVRGYTCQFCTSPLMKAKWSYKAALQALESFRSRDIAAIMRRWGDPLPVMAGALRLLIVAEDGHDLICSDFSAVEAVGLAMLSNEQWRIDVFRGHGKIYEMSASKITGIPFEEFLRYYEQHEEHHPARGSIGKIAELASGYGGNIGAWKAFGAGEHMTDDQIRSSVKRWRDESPNIRRFWYALEGAAKKAIEYPGNFINAHTDKWGRTTMLRYGLGFICDGYKLQCVLPSGRRLTYHQPSIRLAPMPWGEERPQIHFYGWNTNPKQGKIGWVELRTYGGKLCENVTQAVCRDLLGHSMLRLDEAQYYLIGSTHDEALSEIRKGTGSLEHYNQTMCLKPNWARDWPLKASGWRGREYRKD